MPVSEWISRNAGLTPDKPAILFPGRELGYARLAGLVAQLAAALAARGVKRGDCAAYLGYNSPEMLATMFACARLGALFMPLNWRLAGPEHGQMIKDCRPSVLLVEAPFLAQTRLLGERLHDITLVALGEAPPGWLSYPQFLSGGEGAAPRDAEEDGGTALLICYTSGATGKPKGVILSQAALAANAASSIDMHELGAADRILTTLPLFHVGGLNILTTPALQVGASVVLHPKFDPETALDAIERERITLTVLVPAQLDMLIAHPRWLTADFSSLRMITTGSSIVPERLIRAVHERGVPLVQVYGSTETCPVAAYLKREDAARKAGSAGRPATGCQLRIVGERDDADEEAGVGANLAPGATGEILVRGANVMSGYWQNPTATAEALRHGWFHSGDMGHWDEDGYLFVDGRRKEMIISGGENIYPAEIENVLIECRDIAEAAVLGRPDERWGEVVVAAVVPRDGADITRAQVLGLFEGRLARYKHPKDVVFLAEMPKSALGKVRREDLRSLIETDGAAE